MDTTTDTPVLLADIYELQRKMVALDVSVDTLTNRMAILIPSHEKAKEAPEIATDGLSDGRKYSTVGTAIQDLIAIVDRVNADIKYLTDYSDL